jgi:hypothetical protein
MRTGLLLAWILVPAAGWADVPVTPSEIVVEQAHQMADIISNRDVERLMKFIPQTDKVVYVSDGFPITGDAYRKEIGDFYSSLTSLEFKWERWETMPLSDSAVVFTGWANISSETLTGERVFERAVFTTVWDLEPSGWKRVIAHKTILSE